jgi:hypothetical protein
MEGPMEFPDAALLIGGVLFLFALVDFLARNRIVHRRLTCPLRGEVASVDVLEAHDSGKALVVKSCSLLDDPNVVDCPQACIRQS